MEEKIKMFSLKTILCFLLVFLFLHIFATIYHLYWLFPWFDMPMHFLGGFLLAMVYFWISPKIEISNIKLSKAPKWLIDLVSILSFVILIGVLWEFYEFINDFYFVAGGHIRIFQGGITDTISDLLFDLIGGFAGFAVFYSRSQKTQI